MHSLPEHKLKAGILVALWFLLKTDIEGFCLLIQSMRGKSQMKEKFEKHWIIEQKIDTNISEFIFLTLQQNYFVYHLVTERENTLLEAKLTVPYCR